MQTKPLEGISDHPSYHGAITWSEAETKLKAHGGNCYLTHYTTGRKEYVLSVLNEGTESDEFRHYNLVISDGTFEIQGAAKQFSNIFDLLNFYQTVPVDHKVSTIGECLKCTKKSTNYDPISPPPLSPHCAAAFMGYPFGVHTDSEVSLFRVSPRIFVLGGKLTREGVGGGGVGGTGGAGVADLWTKAMD